MLAVKHKHRVGKPQRRQLAERDGGDLAQRERPSCGIVLRGDGAVVVAVVEGSFGAAGAGGEEVEEIWGGESDGVDEESGQRLEGEDEFESADG